MSHDTLCLAIYPHRVFVKCLPRVVTLLFTFNMFGFCFLHSIYFSTLNDILGTFRVCKFDPDLSFLFTTHYF